MSIFRAILRQGRMRLSSGVTPPVAGPTRIGLGHHIWSYVRAVVRDSSGNIYALLHDIGTNNLYESKNGGLSFSIAPNGSFSGIGENYGIAIDSNDLIHIVYTRLNEELNYRTYDPSTDTLSAYETVYSGKPVFCVIIVLDSNGVPHVAYYRYITIKGTNYRRVFYKNRIGGSWIAEEEVDPAEETHQYTHPSIGIDGSNNIHVSFLDFLDADLWYAKRTGVDVWARTEITTNARVAGMDCLVVDSSGNIRIAYCQTDYDLWFAEYNGGWSLSEIAAGTYRQPALATNGGTYLYIIVQNNDTGNIVLFKKENGSWSSEIVLLWGDNPVSKWSYYWNNQAGAQIDYLFHRIDAGFDYLWWNKYVLT